MEDLIPSKFYLSQNYPNPFKDITTIKYCLPLKTRVNITVFDSKNHKVKELVNSIQEAGTYEVKLKSTDLQSGIYYYQMQAFDPLRKDIQIFADKKKIFFHP